MNFSGRSWLWIAAGGCGSLFLAASLSAQTAAAPDATVALAVQPLPSPAKSPVELFRELLAMDDAAREKFLDQREPAARDRILAKLREYEELPADERELRLRVTELQWHLRPLLALPPEKQTAPLARVPADLRPLVEARLEQWKLLPPALQQEILENDRDLQLYLQLAASSPAQQNIILGGVPAARREQVNEGFTQWRMLPEGIQQKTLSRLDQFMDLTPEEKTRVLGTLSETERRQIAQTLRTFENLPRWQREQCLRSFSSFASLGDAERRQFLKNAERWRLMSPEERQAWRELVQKIPESPPLPEDFSPEPAAATNKS